MSDVTPLMAQYHKIKKEYPDTILLFRVGDFFETFEEDARITSETLGITLTKRSNGKAGDVPLAGFPHHALETYLPKLVRAGFRVAVCEQMENPKFAKGIVKRDVVEVVSPGVALSDKLLENKKNNYLVAYYLTEDFIGISFADISTGEYFAYQVKINELKNQIGFVTPSEILVAKGQKKFFEDFFKKFLPSVRITRIDDWIFNYDFARDLLLNHFNSRTLKGFGIEGKEAAISAAGAVLNYLKETQKENLRHIRNISLFNPTNFMQLDFSTKRNLEIMFSMQDGMKEGSLISIMDKTNTPMGGRMLKKWIGAPLRKLEPILKRQQSVEELVKQKGIRKSLQEELREIGDLERLNSRICTGRATPRELINLKTSLQKIPLIIQLLDSLKGDLISEIKSGLNPLDEVIQKIELAIVDYPPANINDGGIIREGYSPELDELREITRNAKSWIENFQNKERLRTNIPSLKVSYNKVFGYYISVSNAHKNKIPDNYIRKQTLVNSERYITPELKVYEDKILNAQENIAALEYELFNEVRNFVANFAESIMINANLIATLDCFQSFAQCAEDYNYTKPKIDLSDKIEILNGRHPVVERIMPPGEKFHPNSTFLSNGETQIIILTGPNMSGKSVYLRQVGLIVLLAQVGSFVPADSAQIGLVDNIFTRVGASDNITAGESTFLVEMQEAANILNNATPKSLILLDEIGRGTSTFDGISIAWAITEYLHENPDSAAKTIFATHYHELNEMASIYPRIKNFKVEVREYDDKVIFLHKVTPGGADHSYGIQVANMAGLPIYVTERAKEILKNLESKELTPYGAKKVKMNALRAEDGIQLSLFELKDDEIRKEISDVKIETLTPLEALNKLNELKRKVEKTK